MKICSVVLLPALKPACSSAMIFSACGFNLFSMVFSMTLLVWMMRGNVMTEDWVHGVGHLPVCQIVFQIIMRAVITSSPPAWTSSAGMLSTPADFLFFSDCTAASTSLRRMGWSPSVSAWVFIGLVVVQLSTIPVNDMVDRPL